MKSKRSKPVAPLALVQKRLTPLIALAFIGLGGEMLLSGLGLITVGLLLWADLFIEDLRK